MKQLSIALVAGARPNFMKVAPLFHALSGRKESGARNLRNEGVPKERVFLVGNVMIDTLRRNLSRIEDGRRTRSAR